HLRNSFVLLFSSFFFNDSATTELYTLSLHDALPIYATAWRFLQWQAVRVRYHLAGNRQRQADTMQKGFDCPLPRRLSIRVQLPRDRKSTRLNSSHVKISYAVFCLKKKKI